MDKGQGQLLLAFATPRGRSGKPAALAGASTPRTSSPRKTASFFNTGGGLTDVEEFVRILQNKFGSVTRAWRVGLDADESGLLDFREFRLGAKEIGYVGNLRTLWFNLDQQNIGRITLRELDPQAAGVLERFRALSCHKYDTMPNMWHKLLDDDHSGTVSLAEFCENVGQLGYDDEQEAVDLFHLLMVRPGARSIALKDIMFLQGWDQTKRLQAWRKRLPASWINVDPYIVSKDHLSSSGSSSLPGSASSKSDEDYSKHVRDNMPKMQEDFKSFLVERYGSLCKAFDVMDANDNGSLSFVEFSSVVTSVLQYCRPSDAKRLFLSFQEDRDGALTWDELGITAPEWISHTLEKRTKQRQLGASKRAAALAPLGLSPRMAAAKEKHARRVGEARPREDVAFWMPLEGGWGFPPDFDPRRRHKETPHWLSPGTLSTFAPLSAR